MNQSAIILIAEDDEGHAFLVEENLRRAGLKNRIEHFSDGQAALDFLFERGDGPKRQSGQAYLLMLDIRMPKIDGTEVLRRVKADEHLRKMPVIVLTTTDDPREVERCHDLGCSVYVQKPMDYDKFAEAIRRLGLFITLLLVPPLNGRNPVLI